MTGRTVNGYEILEEIGSGGMSRVYRARRGEDGMLVALKILRAENAAPDFAARLEREPEIQRGAGHENIVHLIESFRDGDEFYLVMELVEGRSLAQMIHGETGPLPLDRARWYFRQVLRAVDHLHRLGIVHRDIKPSNILIDGNDRARLADFGIARFTWQQAHTATQRGLGTPEYMSPEQARGGAVDHRSDLYSLGVTLYETLTGRKPFARREDTPAAYMETISAILSAPLPDPRSFNPSLSDDVVRLLEKSTAKNPEERFQSCAEMLGALEIVGASPSFTASPIPPPSIGAPPPISPVRSVAATDDAPTVVGPASRAAWATGDATRSEVGQTPAPRTPPEVERRRRSVLPWVLLIVVVLGAGGYFGLQWYQQRQAEQNAVPAVKLADADAMRIAQGVARDIKRFQFEANAGALASLYAEDSVQFYAKKGMTRRAMQTEISKLTDRLLSTSRFDVEIRSARALNDSTIQSEWIISYERLRNDSTILRGSTSIMLTLRRFGTDWLIVKEAEKWSKKNNVPPPKREPEVSDVDSVVLTPTERLNRSLDTLGRALDSALRRNREPSVENLK